MLHYANETDISNVKYHLRDETIWQQITTQNFDIFMADQKCVYKTNHNLQLCPRTLSIPRMSEPPAPLVSAVKSAAGIAATKARMNPADISAIQETVGTLASATVFAAWTMTDVLADAGIGKAGDRRQHVAQADQHGPGRA
ncbi:hypothetical protein [Collimonas pratensis]|uniref:hypothetical protein n=1 Tax=Collimonas pratensis TaxID=279113 RepID=UPI0012373969|nr:hypothetical protein [Collimonas pratensis]